MSKKGATNNLDYLKVMAESNSSEIQQLRSQVAKLTEILGVLPALIRTVGDLNNETPSGLKSRLEAIERRIAQLPDAPKQGKADYLEIMTRACREASGRASVSIPWEKIDDRHAFQTWFAEDIKRWIVDDCVGCKLPSNENTSFCDETPYVVKPACLLEFQ